MTRQPWSVAASFCWFMLPWQQDRKNKNISPIVFFYCRGWFLGKDASGRLKKFCQRLNQPIFNRRFFDSGEKIPPTDKFLGLGGWHRCLLTEWWLVRWFKILSWNNLSHRNIAKFCRCVKIGFHLWRKKNEPAAFSLFLLLGSDLKQKLQPSEAAKLLFLMPIRVVIN